MDAIESAKLRLLYFKCHIADKPALEAIFHRYNPALKYYLRRLLDRDDVGDVIQEIWLKVIRQLRTLRAPEAFTVWIYRIARSKASDHLCRAQAAGQFEGGSRRVKEVADEPRYAGIDPPRTRRSFTPPWARLPADAALKPLTLRFLEDLSYEEIAHVTGCAVGTVRSRLHYAKAAMRQLMESHHD